MLLEGAEGLAEAAGAVEVGGEALRRVWRLCGSMPGGAAEDGQGFFKALHLVEDEAEVHEPEGVEWIDAGGAAKFGQGLRPLAALDALHAALKMPFGVLPLIHETHPLQCREDTRNTPPNGGNLPKGRGRWQGKSGKAKIERRDAKVRNE
jgi:hypothetical protein